MDTYLPTLTVAGVLGFLAPLLSAALSKLTWSSQVRQIVAAVVSVFMAVVAILVTGGFSERKPDEDPVVYWILIAFAVIAVAQLAYALIWKPQGTMAKLEVLGNSKAELEQYITEHTIPGEVADKTVYAAKHRLETK